MVRAQNLQSYNQPSKGCKILAVFILIGMYVMISFQEWKELSQVMTKIKPLFNESPDRIAEQVIQPFEVTNSGVMIVMKYGRDDRLGSAMMRPMHLLAYAHCEGHEFCVHTKDWVIDHYPFIPACPVDHFPLIPACPVDLEEKFPKAGTLFQDPINKTGSYQFLDDDDSLRKWASQNEICIDDDSFRVKWREILLNASHTETTVGNTTLKRQELFPDTTNNNITTVAIHIRRGDYADLGRHVIYDGVYVSLIKKLRSMLLGMGRIPNMHVFSEKFGMISRKHNVSANWSLFDGIVDEFHFAPEMGPKDEYDMDVSLNIRDWKHFVTADIFVVSNSAFSIVPAAARPNSPDPKTGLPLTLFSCIGNSCYANDSVAKFVYGWDQTIDGHSLLNLTNIPNVFSKHEKINN